MLASFPYSAGTRPRCQPLVVAQQEPVLPLHHLIMLLLYMQLLPQQMQAHHSNTTITQAMPRVCFTTKALHNHAYTTTQCSSPPSLQM